MTARGYMTATCPFWRSKAFWFQLEHFGKQKHYASNCEFQGPKALWQNHFGGRKAFFDRNCPFYGSTILRQKLAYFEWENFLKKKLANICGPKA